MAGHRTGEIGIRIALGAEPLAILRLMLRDGLKLVALGTVLGPAGAVWSVRYVESQLFGVQPTDPMTFGAVVGGLVAAVACLAPARRAMRVDPVIALRSS